MSNLEEIDSVLLDAPPVLFKAMLEKNMSIDILSARYPHFTLATMSVCEADLNKIKFTYFKGYPTWMLPNIKNESKFILESVIMHLIYLDFEPNTYFAEVKIMHLERRTTLRCVFKNNSTKEST